MVRRVSGVNAAWLAMDLIVTKYVRRIGAGG
jgi:hypothetical protein